MINPKSLENLRSFDTIDRDLHRSISSKAGKKSGESRRKKKQEQEIITALTKYGSAFKIFLDLSEMSPSEFNKAVNDAMKKQSRLNH